MPVAKLPLSRSYNLQECCYMGFGRPDMFETGCKNPAVLEHCCGDSSSSKFPKEWCLLDTCSKTVQPLQQDAAINHFGITHTLVTHDESSHLGAIVFPTKVDVQVALCYQVSAKAVKKSQFAIDRRARTFYTPPSQRTCIRKHRRTIRPAQKACSCFLSPFGWRGKYFGTSPHR